MGSKRMCLCIVCALVVAMLLVAANESSAEEGRDERPEQGRRESVDRDEQGPPQEFLEIRNRIDKLRAMAREAEEKARLLWTEAEELERNLGRGFERRVEPERIQEMHAMLTDLKEAAARAEREGRHDEAAALHENAEAIAREIEAHVERGEDRVPPDLGQRLEGLRHAAGQAEERGEFEKARDLLNEAERLERKIRQGFERQVRPGGPERAEQMHARLAELNEAAEHAEREGRHDEAAELHEEARRIGEEIEAHVGRGEQRIPPELARRLEELRHMAREAEERGEIEKARHLLAEAEQLERKLRQRFEREQMPERMEQMHRRLAELKEAAEHAERQGRHDEAARLGEEAHKLAMQIEKTARRDKMPDVGEQIERLYAMAAKAKEAGRYEEAEAILREAKSLERRDKGMVERPKEGPAVKELLRQIEMLREEVGRLRRDVEQFRGERRDRDRPGDRDR